MKLSDYQQRILQLDSDIADLEVKKVKFLRVAREKYYPQLKKGTLIKFRQFSTVKYGRIMFAHLDNRNPFRVKINVKPCKINGERINRVVLHCINISDKDVLEILLK